LEYAKSQYFVSQIEITLRKRFIAALQNFAKPASIKADSLVSRTAIVHFS